VAIDLPVAGQASFSGGVLRILIIDDNRTDREIYKRSLTVPPGIRLEFAETDSGTEGVEKAKHWQPDCVLLDYHLPDMDGLEVLARLTPPEQPLFPVVMLTAYGGEVLAVQAMKAGATDYLPKQHAKTELLLRAVSNAVERFQMQRQIADQRLALEQSARRYKDLLEAMPQMVWMADTAGCVEYANRRWFDYTAAGLAGHRLDWNQVVHPEDQERTWRSWMSAVESGTTFEIEHRLRKASDGEFRWHLVRAVPMRHDDSTVRWFGTCTEIEDQKREQEEKLQRQKLESVGRLAGGIAHDFNNLLVSILGGATLVSEHLAGGNPAQPMLRDVISAGERAAHLTRQLLAYAGKANLFVERVDLAQIVSQTCDGIRATIPRKTRLEVQNAPGLPPIETDLAQIRQVATDLIVNAKEALDRTGGTVTVRTGVEDIGQDSSCSRFGLPEIGTGLYVVLEVQDDGCGMDEETQEKMFDPFFSTKATGRGLGLASVQGFVRTNRGGIQVDSSPSAGTRIRVLLPAAATSAAQSGR
jgi:PAS domain S-box-containing protein